MCSLIMSLMMLTDFTSPLDVRNMMLSKSQIIPKGWSLLNRQSALLEVTRYDQRSNYTVVMFFGGCSDFLNTFKFNTSLVGVI